SYRILDSGPDGTQTTLTIKCNKAWKLDYSDLTEAEKTNVTNANSNAGRVASKLKKYSVNPNKRY
ncbi:hypothetical protein ORT89_17815, partial [Escherichia coli]|nr:hypothetical protein [Escherichia coli]